jgi:cell filamentation protein
MDGYRYEYEWDSSYCYPNSFVLVNKMGIKDAKALSTAEREITSTRLTQLEVKPVKGNFDLQHLQKIHHLLFQDVYSWAGALRTVNIAKGNQFCNCLYLESGSLPLFDRFHCIDCSNLIP